MPEPREPRSGQSMSSAGNAPPVQGQTEQQWAQDLDPDEMYAPLDADAEADGDDDLDGDMNQRGTLSWLARQFSFVFIPFLFAIVTILLTFLFLIARGQGVHSLAVTELWATGLIALAMAVLQGMMLYYSGSNSGLWFLSLLVGFVLFPPVLFFALDGAAASLITLVVMVLVFIAIALFCLKHVQAGHVGIVCSFGNYVRTLPPGPHFLPPWERVTHTPDMREKQWTSPQQVVHMSPTKDLLLSGTIAYELIPEEAYHAVLDVDNWERQLQKRFCAILQDIATQFKPEDFYSWQSAGGNRPHPNAGTDANAGSPNEKTSSWSRMNARLLQVMREQAVSWGIRINWTAIHDVVPIPHVDQMDAVRTGMRTAGTAATGSTASTANATLSSRPGATREAPASSQGQSRPPTAEARPVQSSSSAPAGQPQQTGAASYVKLYEDVSNGIITDPDVIRRIAKKFEAIAQNPRERQNFPFDAARAASNLYARAKYYEDRISASAEFIPGDEYDEDNGDIAGDLSGETQPDWRHPTPHPDDDLMGGG